MRLIAISDTHGHHNLITNIAVGDVLVHAGDFMNSGLFVGEKRCMLKRSVATLLIDDRRNLPADRVARTYKAGIDALMGQHWNLLYLDHDLGDFSGAGGREMTGYDIACWLEQNPRHLPDRIEIVSNNPAGRRNIELALQRCRR